MLPVQGFLKFWMFFWIGVIVYSRSHEPYRMGLWHGIMLHICEILPENWLFLAQLNVKICLDLVFNKFTIRGEKIYWFVLIFRVTVIYIKKLNIFVSEHIKSNTQPKKKGYCCQTEHKLYWQKFWFKHY